MEDKKHFLQLDNEELVADLCGKVADYYEHMRRTGQLKRIRDSYLMYHGYDRNTANHMSSDILFAGDRGEITLSKVNHVRNLVQHFLALTTSDRPAFDPVAANDTYEAYEAVDLSKDILQYYSHELEQTVSRVTERAWVTSEGFLLVEWDPTSGDTLEYDDETGEARRQGDFRFEPFSALDIVRVPNKIPEQVPWWIVRKKLNRFDVAAQYPEHKDYLLCLEETDQAYRREGTEYPGSWSSQNDEDIYVYTLYHKKTPAVPNGAMVVFVEGQILLRDVLPYRELTLIRESPGDFLDSSLGYTPVFDILGLQEAYDSLFSTVLTNQTAFGVQTISATKSSGLTYDSLDTGLGVIWRNDGTDAPVPLNFTKTPPEIFEFIRMVASQMEMLMGANSVVRGQPNDNIKTGSAMALLVANATQFASAFTRSHTQLQERLATLILTILQDFAEDERIITIVGPNRRPAIRRFTGGQLKSIRKVFVNIGSPLTRVTAGRLQIAQDLIQTGASPERYMEVVETGRLTPVTSREHSQFMLLQSENDEIKQGIVPPVLKTDVHPEHILSHQEPLNNPDARRNPRVVEVALAHIAEHYRVWGITPPNELLAMGMQPLAPVAPEELAPKPMQGEGGQPAALQAGIDSAVGPGRPEGQPPNLPNMPNLPKPPQG